MHIKDLYRKKSPLLSFEIFPPKPDYPLETVYETIEGLKELKPDFISVTYGAGGSNRARTIEIASHIRNFYQQETLAHLTCIGHSPAELDLIIDELKVNGIENILALRGDPPQEWGFYEAKPGYYKYAIDLVKHIRSKGGFSIGAAAYPEGHKECPRWQDDWGFLREKIFSGVDFLITQLFFDNRIFFNFKENLLRMGVNIPISAGIMPVLNSKQIRRMIYLSEASIPAQLLKVLDKYGDDIKEFEKAGIDYAVNQINGLINNGVEGIHLYTMNRVKETKIILQNINLTGRS